MPFPWLKHLRSWPSLMIQNRLVIKRSSTSSACLGSCVSWHFYSNHNLQRHHTTDSSRTETRCFQPPIFTYTIPIGGDPHSLFSLVFLILWKLWSSVKTHLKGHLFSETLWIILPIICLALSVICLLGSPHYNLHICLSDHM